MKIEINWEKDWLTVIGLILAVAGIVYTYYTTTIVRDPILIIDSRRVEVVNYNNIINTPINVTRTNGEEIKSDVTSVRFYFGNKGKKSIKNEDVLEKIVFKIDDPNAEILDFKVLKLSRNVIDFKLIPVSEEKNSVYADFRILESRDAAECQITYTGNPKAEIKVYGIIEDTKAIVVDLLDKYLHKKELSKRSWGYDSYRIFRLDFE